LPLNLARELILTGDPIDAARAYAAGLVNVLSEPGQALDAAVGLAMRICRNAPLSVQASLAAVNGVVRSGDPAGWDLTREAQESLGGTHDLEEGIQAFLEKRAPQWTGR
jgi:enoyl-CoA hydratase/carnithine racemase